MRENFTEDSALQLLNRTNTCLQVNATHNCHIVKVPITSILHIYMKKIKLVFSPSNWVLWRKIFITTLATKQK